MDAHSLRARLRPLMRRTSWAGQALQSIRSLRFALHTPRRAFDDIHRRHFLKSREDRERAGPHMPESGHIRLLLQALIEKYDVQTLLHIPCGDFHWLSRIDLNGCTYIGGDVLPEVVQANTERFAGPACSFRRIDILRDRLPRAEMLLCRDLLVHLSTAHIRRALANIKRCDIRFLLTTHYVRAGTYEDIATGGWRPVNFRLAPFHFPEPLETLFERAPDCGDYRGARALGKSLALWRMCDLPG
ncbi:MAG: class I SAM-dependent methyltransferase [Alphaproteobacteria bacterium]